MPKVVDRDERRQALAAAAARVLVADGLDGFTTRRITEEASVSKGILSHYFDGKAELFIATLEVFYQRIGERMRVATAEVSGLDAARAAMVEALPLDSSRRDEAVAEISFAAAGVSDPELRNWYRSQRSTFRSVLAGFLADGGLDEAASGDGADQLLAFMDSVSLQSVIGGDIDADVQLDGLDRLLARLTHR